MEQHTLCLNMPTNGGLAATYHLGLQGLNHVAYRASPPRLVDLSDREPAYQCTVMLLVSATEFMAQMRQLMRYDRTWWIVQPVTTAAYSPASSTAAPGRAASPAQPQPPAPNVS